MTNVNSEKVEALNSLYAAAVVCYGVDRATNLTVNCALGCGLTERDAYRARLAYEMSVGVVTVQPDPIAVKDLVLTLVA